MSANSEPCAGDDAVRLVVLPKSLHARPAGRITQAANRYRAAIVLSAGDRHADARSVLAVMGLGAIAGTEVRITTTGPDAADAADAIAELLADLANT
jgi:phosphocarrier protein HPr